MNERYDSSLSKAARTFKIFSNAKYLPNNYHSCLSCQYTSCLQLSFQFFNICTDAGRPSVSDNQMNSHSLDWLPAEASDKTHQYLYLQKHKHKQEHGRISMTAGCVTRTSFDMPSARFASEWTQPVGKHLHIILPTNFTMFPTIMT